jgi:hypothetical protein
LGLAGSIKMSISTVHSFSQYENKKDFVINQEIVAIQHFIKFAVLLNDVLYEQ